MRRDATWASSAHVGRRGGHPEVLDVVLEARSLERLAREVRVAARGRVGAHVGDRAYAVRREELEEAFARVRGVPDREDGSRHAPVGRHSERRPPPATRSARVRIRTRIVETVTLP
jgi:hypothetical protein